jgi:hypothetical protein
MSIIVTFSNSELLFVLRINFTTFAVKKYGTYLPHRYGILCLPWLL